ncbi:MAG: hypothetical protein AAGA76_01525 [Pseudomonadota bacterium]
MKNFISKFVLALLVGAISFPVHAEQTDWFKGRDRAKIAKQMKGKLLQEIECRDKKTVGLHLARDEFRVTYTDNPEKTRYLWAVGNQFGRYKAYADKNGYKMVSINQYVRESGLKIRCAVWHKPS